MSSLADTALRLITQYGRSVSLKFRATGAADPEKPWRADSTGPGNTDVMAVFEENADSELAKSLFRALSGGQGDPPRRGRASFLVAGLSLTDMDYKEIVGIQDTLNGFQWRVTNIQPIQPGEELYAVVIGVDR